MKPTPPPNDANRDLAAYIDGDPDAVRGARPSQPSESEWDIVRRRVHARLAQKPNAEPRRRVGLWIAATATLATAAAAIAWVAIALNAPQPQPKPDAPEVAEVKPVAALPVAPAPREAQPDPLAAFDVLPMASTDEVVLHRVPGDGWLPVGTPLLPGGLSLATANDVELEDPNPAWPSVTPAPGFMPMIFAAKPR